MLSSARLQYDEDAGTPPYTPEYFPNLNQTVSMEGIGREVAQGSLLSSKKNEVREIVSQYSMYFTNDFRISLLKQTTLLFEEEDWEETDTLPSTNSFRALMRAVALIKPMKRPGLGLTSDGNFLAMWSDDRAKVTLEFIPGDLVRWYVITKVGGQTDTATGRTATLRISSILTGHHAREPLDGA